MIAALPEAQREKLRRVSSSCSYSDVVDAYIDVYGPISFNTNPSYEDEDTTEEYARQIVGMNVERIHQIVKEILNERQETTRWPNQD